MPAFCNPLEILSESECGCFPFGSFLSGRLWNSECEDKLLHILPARTLDFPRDVLSHLLPVAVDRTGTLFPWQTPLSIVRETDPL